MSKKLLFPFAKDSSDDEKKLAYDTMVEREFSTSGHKKFVRYLEAVLNTDEYRQLITNLRIKYSIPKNGFPPMPDGNGSSGYIFPVAAWNAPLKQEMSLRRITSDDYDKKLKELKDKQYNLNLELEEHTKADHEYHTHVNTVLNLTRRMQEIFDSSEIAEKRQILNFLLQNPTVSEKKLEFTLRKPFDAVLELAQHPTRLAVWDDVGTLVEQEIP